MCARRRPSVRIQVTLPDKHSVQYLAGKYQEAHKMYSKAVMTLEKLEDDISEGILGSGKVEEAE